ncbi:MAG: carboxypeptidase-like regulatory domain-containing protein, partial [Armatimonadota bacterium]
MKRLFVLALVFIAAIGASAQENSVTLRGRVFAPDGTPVRNREGSLHLRLDLLGDKAVISEAVDPAYQPIDHSVNLTFNVKTDENGVFQTEQNRDYLQRERGKRALARIYMLVPEVGVIMTRRFFWTVSEPLPDLHLKPLARLKVDIFYPTLNVSLKHEVQVSRVDDPQVTWMTEWVPADEWLTVSGISVKLKPGEEKHLLIPQMPPSWIPVYLTVCLPYGEQFQPSQKRLPPLLVSESLLRGRYGIWEGLAPINRGEPFSFVFVPPMHLLRIPTEQIEMKPFMDTVPSFDYLVAFPITEIECNLKMDDARAKSLFSKWHAFSFNRRGWEQWKEVMSRLFLYEESEALLPRAEHESLHQWLWRPSFEDLPRRFWITQWTPLIACVSIEKDRRYTLAFPVKGGEAAKRKHFTVVSFLPEQQPKVLRLKTGQLKGTVRTLDGKPVAETSVIARFVEDKLVERLTEEGEVDFLTETDKQGNFVFTDLPEGKYDLFVLSINPWWVGCVEAIVKAGQTTMVNLVGYFEQEQKPTRRRITLRLQFPDGTPVAGYLVNAVSTFSVSGLTDEQGRISLEVEGEQLEIRWFEIADVPTISLHIHPEQSEFTVTVPVPLRGMVEGCVLLPDGSTSDKVLVTAWKLWKGRWPESTYHLRVLPDGRFFCTLPEGTYIFKAEPMLPNLPLNSIYCAPSLSPPVVVKGGEVTKVTWQLRPATSRYLEFPFWRGLPPIGT